MCMMNAQCVELLIYVIDLKVTECNAKRCSAKPSHAKGTYFPLRRECIVTLVCSDVSIPSAITEVWSTTCYQKFSFLKK